MSSEKLENINQDQPKIDQQPTIKFVSDELGLGTPLSQIPTDVEYFLNKQRGVGESTYDFGKATEEAFKIDMAEEDSLKLRTVRDMCVYVKTKLDAKKNT